MLLHVRITTEGGGPTEDAARRAAENKQLEKNRIIESFVDPSVDPSPDTRPSLTYCNRHVVYGGPEKIQHIHSPLLDSAKVCEVCEARSAMISEHELLYIRDDQTAAPSR